MLEQYRVPFEGEFKGQNAVAVYELSLVDKLFYRIMKSWIVRNLKKAVPLERHVRVHSNTHAYYRYQILYVFVCVLVQ